MRNKIESLTTLLLFAFIQPLLAQDGQPLPVGPPLGLSNFSLSVRLLSPISTKTSHAGDRFSAQVLTPEILQNAVIEGRISSVRMAQKRNKAEISFAFERLIIKGIAHPIQADLKEVTNSKGLKNVDEEGRAIGTSSKKKAAESALIGSALGALIGGLAAGGRGAAIGAGAGAGAGLVFAVKFTTSGSDVEFAPGSQLVLNVSDRSRQ